MFEKEAEKYYESKPVHTYVDSLGFFHDLEGIKQAYIQGRIDERKANEWHILAENQNDLPPKETTVKVLTQNGEICESKYYYDDYYEENSWSNIGDSKVLGWKEIVLPKESK